MATNYLVDLITQSIDDGVIFIDQQQIIKIFNPAAVRYSGVTSQEAVNKLFSTTLSFSSDDTDSVEDLVSNTLNGHDSTLYHQAIIECDGQVNQPIIFRLVPVHDEQHRISGCLFIFRDYHLDRYKTDFLSLVAHQLKTPLGSMRWNLEALLTSSTSDTLLDVYNCNSRMISLVDDLLNASRIDSKKVVNKPSMTNISTTINNALKELTYQIQQKNLIINLQTDPELEIMIDTRHFREVIENLLSNAIKYNRQKGNINITVEKQIDQASISIGDTGIGIPDTELPRIFSRSFRARNAIETSVDGSGLGLYVAKSFVEDWGGSISCHSVYNQGTTITFTVPLVVTKSTLGKNLAI